MKILTKIRWYHLLLGSLLLLVIWVELARPVPVDWSHGYSKKESKPYGSLVLFRELEKLYPGKKISTSSIPPYNSLDDEARGQSAIYISTGFAPVKTDVGQLLDFVSAGNRAFIASSFFSGDFSDTLNLKTGLNWERRFSFNPFTDNSDSSIISFNGSAAAAGNYVVSGGATLTSFVRYDTSSVTVLANINDSLPVLIKMKYGSGEFYFCSTPELFSNYHILYGNHEPAFIALASVFDAQEIIWDEYFKPSRTSHRNIYSFIQSQPALKYAYYVLLMIVLVILLLALKRRYPSTPVYSPPANASLAFARTVGTLYFQQKNHKDLAEKMKRYFFEQIRSRFNTDTAPADEEFLKKISERSGVAMEEVKDLFMQLESGRATVSQEDLIVLEKKIRHFNEKSLR